MPAQLSSFLVPGTDANVAWLTNGCLAQTGQPVCARWPRFASPDGKRTGRGSDRFAEPNLIDPRKFGAAPARRQHGLDCFRRTAELGLDVPIRKIADPAREAELAGLSPGPVTKADTLDAA